jgi:NAD(P)-dependent dehydrogenase (short-subunit alcohol dehydrogenase family)
MMTKNVLISGGSGDIGVALCRELANAGYRPLVGYSKNAAAGEKVASETGGLALHLDLSDEGSIDKAVAQILAEEFPLAGIVLAASPPPTILPLFKIPESDFADQWHINVDGPRKLLADIIRKSMRPNKQGWIVGILSQAMGSPDLAAKNMGSYIIAKYGLLGLLKTLETEYSWLNVISVKPGYTETKMLDVYDDRFLDQLREKEPIDRFSLPEEIAQEIIMRIPETK